MSYNLIKKLDGLSLTRLEEKMSENIYTKSKTNALSSAHIDDSFEFTDSTFKVKVKENSMDLIISYLTNMYANAPAAVARELFTNACDASSQDSEVELQISSDEDNDSRYCFTVLDHGCGMSYDEVIDNYVTYANSSKVDDYDAVGAFGIGSKSPLAISPTFDVESSNGVEQTKCTVSATRRGVWGNAEKADDVSGKTFTRVCVHDISSADACSMHNFISRTIIPFSKHHVKYNCDGVFDDARSEFKHTVKVSHPDDAYDVTLYVHDADEVIEYLLFGIRGTDTNFNPMARVNSIAYDVDMGFYTSYYGPAIVIDVESGYFQFSPSRESLPSGKKLDHIKDIMAEVAGRPLDEKLDALFANEVDSGILNDVLNSHLIIRKMSAESVDRAIDALESAGYGCESLKLVKEHVYGASVNAVASNNDINVTAYTLSRREFRNNRKMARKVEFKSVKNAIGGATLLQAANDIVIVKGVKKTRAGKLVTPLSHRATEMSQMVKQKFEDAGANGSKLPASAQVIVMLVADDATADTIEGYALAIKAMTPTIDNVSVVQADYSLRPTPKAAAQKPDVAERSCDVLVASEGGVEFKTMKAGDIIACVNGDEAVLAISYSGDNAMQSKAVALASEIVGAPVIAEKDIRLKTVKKHIFASVDRSKVINIDDLSIALNRGDADTHSNGLTQKVAKSIVENKFLLASVEKYSKYLDVYSINGFMGHLDRAGMHDALNRLMKEHVAKFIDDIDAPYMKYVKLGASQELDGESLAAYEAGKLVEAVDIYENDYIERKKSSSVSGLIDNTNHCFFFNASSGINPVSFMLENVFDVGKIAENEAVGLAIFGAKKSLTISDLITGALTSSFGGRPFVDSMSTTYDGRVLANAIFDEVANDRNGKYGNVSSTLNDIVNVIIEANNDRDIKTYGDIYWKLDDEHEIDAFIKQKLDARLNEMVESIREAIA